MQDRFEDLRTFVAVVQDRSFSGAARRLGVVKSAVSRRVQELERRLGVLLINRSTRNLSLTDTGRLFYEKATALLEGLEEAEGLASHGAVEPSGNLRVLAPASFGPHLLPLISNFLEQHRRLSIELSMSDAMVDLMAEGFDMAVRIGTLHDSNLHARTLAPVRRVACASPAYIARHGAPFQPSELIHHRGICYSNVDEHRFWRFIDPRTGAEHSVTSHSKLKVNSGDALCQAVLAGAGITALPTFIIYKHVLAGDLVPVMLPFEKVPTKLQVVFPSRKLVPAKVKAFADCLALRFTDQPYWDQELFVPRVVNRVPLA